MARVNCYLPDDLKAAFEAIDPPVAFSSVLRAAVVARLREHQGSAKAVPAEPEPVR